MSRYAEEQACDKITDCPEPAIAEIISPREKDLGGFSVRRLLPVTGRKMVGPWIFFDHMGPANFEPGKGIDVRPHPHINLATVTYLFEGEMLHRDSLGSEQVIRPGDINLMVAGKGIVHSERERPDIREREHTQHGLQLWLALPEGDEECEPAFYHYPADSIPRVDVDGVSIRVMMGEAYGLLSPVKTFARTLYLEAEIPAGATLSIPREEQRALYLVSGRASLNSFAIGSQDMAVLDARGEVVINALEATRLVVIGGQSLGRRYIDWNFVSSSKTRIEQAKRLWREGGFGKVPGDEEEFIPLPE